MEAEQEVSPSLPSLGKGCKALLLKSSALAYGPEVNFQESKREPRRAVRVLETNSKLD